MPISVPPAIVKVSPTILAVVVPESAWIVDHTFCVPPLPPPPVLVIVNVSPTIEVEIPVPPTILNTSLTVSAVVWPESDTIVLNLSSVCNADNSNDLWSYITNYTPELKKGLNKKFDMLVDLSVNYYKQRVLPFKKFRLPSEFETKTIKNLVTYLKDLDAKTSNEEIQSIVFKVGKEAGYENLREWFSCLYETALGQSSGPRMGGFIKLYGINKSIKLLEDVLNGSLVK